MNIQTPYRISFSIITIKIPFLNSLLISLRYKSIKGIFCTKNNIFTGGGYFIDMPIEVKWFSIIGFLILLINLELNTLLPYNISLGLTNLKTPFLSNFLIFF